MKNILLIPFRVVYKIYYLFVFAFSLIITYPFMRYFLANPNRFPSAFRLIKIHAHLLLIFAGAKLKVKGVENIPKTGAYIICPNHTSFIDIFCVYSIFSQYLVFTGKKEIEKWPLFHIYYTSGMNILVDRHSKTGSINALKRMYSEVDKGNPLAIFPEGTISKNAPRMGDFKSGSFTIAIQKQIPIIPVTFVTNWEILQRGNFWMGKCGPGVAEVVIHEPVSTFRLKKENIDELSCKIKEIIRRPLDKFYNF
jgi:1-acyl-sn-glycerol-3-phosphate acyltransferase